MSQHLTPTLRNSCRTSLNMQLRHVEGLNGHSRKSVQEGGGRRMLVPLILFLAHGHGPKLQPRSHISKGVSWYCLRKVPGRAQQTRETVFKAMATGREQD